MTFEKISEHNIEALTHLMLKLWPDCMFEEEYSNCKRILHIENETCFLGKENEMYIAFIQLSIRNEYVEGANSSPVLYIEGIYVHPDFRRAGIGKKLVGLAETWGKQNNCKQIASDAELENVKSIKFHESVNFTEVNRIVSFIKDIS